MKKLAILKIILFISIIGLIIFSLLFVLYIYDITQKNKTSENLASSFSVSYLYSKNPSYTAILQNSNDFSEEIGDEFAVYGLDGKALDYKIFDKKEVESTDLSCTSQETNGKKIVTLMTCNSIKQTRIILQAENIE